MRLFHDNIKIHTIQVDDHPHHIIISSQTQSYHCCHDELHSYQPYPLGTLFIIVLEPWSHIHEHYLLYSNFITSCCVFIVPIMNGHSPIISSLKASSQHGGQTSKAKQNSIISGPSKHATWSWEQDPCLEMGILYGFRSLTCKKTGNMLYNNPKWGGEGQSLLCNSLSCPDAMYVIELKSSYSL